jgi:iron-sulfur cluster repair protein YtfE (RIC family)
MATETSQSCEQIQREHEQLRERLKVLHQKIEVHPAPPEEVATLLRELRVALESHFQCEENGGFFDDIVTQAPQLSRQAQKLTHEHVDLLKHADTLVQMAEESQGQPICDPTLASRFRYVSRLLMHHESEENGMLQTAFQDDLGTKD